MRMSKGLKRGLIITSVIILLFIAVVIITEIAVGFSAGYHQTHSSF